MRILMLMLAIMSQPDQRWDFQRRVGVVRVDSGEGCLAINDQSLQRWKEIFVVGLEERPARTFSATVESTVESCPGLPGFESAYRVTFSGDVPAAKLMGAATGVSRIIRYREGRIGFRLSPAPSPHLLQFASCSEARGLRVDVSSRHPTPGTRVSSVLVPGVFVEAPVCPKEFRDWARFA